MEEQLLGLLSARRGHFLLESGHHGNLWLDLDSLFLRPAALLPFTRELARRLGRHGSRRSWSARWSAAPSLPKWSRPSSTSASPSPSGGRAREGVTYAIPDAFHDHLRGRTVAIVDDAINAGSATRATFAALTALGARPVAVGAC